jgi:hypothetical protein
MNTEAFRFELASSIPIAEAEMSLHVGLFAIEGLFGEARTRLEAGYHLDEAHNVIVVNGSGEVGAALVKVFTGLLLREFGEDAFTVRRIGPNTTRNSSVAVTDADRARTPVAA